MSDSKEIVIGLDHSHLNAYLSIIPVIKGRMFDVREVFELLDTERVVHGVKRGRISDLVAQVNDTQVPIKDEVIAQGTPVIPGQDARIKFHFKTNKEIELVEDDEGNIDHKELNLINNVEKDDLLAEKIPSVDPQAGTDLYGEPIIPTPVKDVNFVAGNNVRVTEDKMRCFSEIDGQVFLKNRIIQVSPIYTVPGDVDLKVGNISFNGSIIVNGNVLSGFTLKAKENITIKGVVEAATLIAGGNILLQGGIKGRGKANIQCKGDFQAGFVEQSTIECHGSVKVTSSIVNSDVTCYSKIDMSSGKGSIVGGEIRAIGGIFCMEAGSKLGVITRLIAGDKFIVRQRIMEVTKNLTDSKEELHKLEISIKQNEAVFANLMALPEDKRAPLQAILEKRMELTEAVKDLEMKSEKLNALFKVKCEALIKVKKTTHPSTMITVGHSTLQVKSSYLNTCFSENHQLNTIKISGLA